jgi:hypothetical protein
MISVLPGRTSSKHSGVRVLHADGAIVGARVDVLSFGRELYQSDRVYMRFTSPVSECSVMRIPYKNGAIIGARNNKCVVGRERHPFDPFLMPIEYQQ